VRHLLLQATAFRELAAPLGLAYTNTLSDWKHLSQQLPTLIDAVPHLTGSISKATLADVQSAIRKSVVAPWSQLSITRPVRVLLTALNLHPSRISLLDQSAMAATAAAAAAAGDLEASGKAESTGSAASSSMMAVDDAAPRKWQFQFHSETFHKWCHDAVLFDSLSGKRLERVQCATVRFCDACSRITSTPNENDPGSRADWFCPICHNRWLYISLRADESE